MRDSHVVDLTGPNAVENEKQLDKNASERQDPSHDNPRYRLGVDRLVRDLPGDLVGPDWLLYARLPEAKVSSDEGEGDGDSKPEGQERHQGEEGDGG